MLKLVLATVLVLSSVSLPAQNVPTRMERDMKIFSTMLDEYMEKNIGKNNMFNNNTKIEYLDGFGVLVKVVCNNNWESRGQISFTNEFGKFKKFEFSLDKPNTRVRTGSGNVKVRTTTKNGKTTVVTNDNGKVTTVEFDENDKDGNHKNHNKNYNKNDKSEYKYDYQDSKADQKRAKADLKRAKKDLERSQKDLEQAQKEIEKDTKNSDKQLRKEMKEAEKEMKEAEREMKEAEKEMLEAEREMQKADKEMQKEMAIYQATEDSSNKMADAKTESEIRDFLVQYSDLITELKPNERIRIMYSDGKQMNGMDFVWNGEGMNESAKAEKNQPKGLEVFKNDIDSYKSSKKEKDFKARIKQVAPAKNKESLKVALLSSVFDRVIAETKGESIKAHGKTQVSYLEDYAVKYDSKLLLKNKMYFFDNETSNQKDNQKDNQKRNDNASQESNIKKQQDFLEKTGKEYFLLYGKTIASELKNNEKLIWEIDFGDKPKTEINATNTSNNIFSKITFMVTKNILEDLDNRKISLEQAMAQVKTEKK